LNGCLSWRNHSGRRRKRRAVLTQSGWRGWLYVFFMDKMDFSWEEINHRNTAEVLFVYKSEYVKRRTV